MPDRYFVNAIMDHLCHYKLPFSAKVSPNCQEIAYFHHFQKLAKKAVNKILFHFSFNCFQTPWATVPNPIMGDPPCIVPMKIVAVDVSPEFHMLP